VPAVLDGRIHVLGGEANRTFAQNEAYDPVTDSWSSFAPLPTPRHGLGVVAADDAIYVIAGGPQPGDTRSNIVEIFRVRVGLQHRPRILDAGRGPPLRERGRIGHQLP
jgi:hypothetical protein